MSETIRTMLEAREEQFLDPRAAKSAASKGREKPLPKDPLRTEWQRDRDRILHTKAFRRLKHKTQVFVSPGRDHYRTRLTHTLEVTQISRTVARALCLNEDLTEAIGYGHDLGHAPFGHAGEYALDEAYREFDPDAWFRHYEQSLRIVDVLERNGEGLNLTWEVRDGILHHSKGKKNLGEGDLPATLEGQVIRICDRVAYVNHDIDDAIRAGLITAQDLPRECVAVLGTTHSGRITTMVNSIVNASSISENGERRVGEKIVMSDEVREATDALKNWMFQHVYLHPKVDESTKIKLVVKSLFAYFMEHPAAMRGEYAVSAEEEKVLSHQQLARRVCDFVSGMTDRFASQMYAELFLPSTWQGV
jgi:dGTPase